MHTCIHAYIVDHNHTYMCTHVYARAHTHTHNMHPQIHIHIYACIHKCIILLVFDVVNVYVYTHTHTYIHTYIHTKMNDTHSILCFSGSGWNQSACMCVCMCVCRCVCVCMYVCMFFWKRMESICECMHVCVYVCVPDAMHVCMYTCMFYVKNDDDSSHPWPTTTKKITGTCKRILFSTKSKLSKHNECNICLFARSGPFFSPFAHPWGLQTRVRFPLETAADARTYQAARCCLIPRHCHLRKTETSCVVAQKNEPSTPHWQQGTIQKKAQEGAVIPHSRYKFSLFLAAPAWLGPPASWFPRPFDLQGYCSRRRQASPTTERGPPRAWTKGRPQDAAFPGECPGSCAGNTRDRAQASILGPLSFLSEPSSCFLETWICNRLGLTLFAHFLSLVCWDPCAWRSGHVCWGIVAVSLQNSSHAILQRASSDVDVYALLAWTVV
jgi:hypothetical protein